MRTIIHKLGRPKLVIIITLLAIILAVGLNYIFQFFQEVSFSYTSLTRAIILPIIIAPLLSWYLIGLFLRVIQLESQMKEWALFDQLTGLFNRRAFLHRAEQEYNVAKRYQETFGILVLDLDHFKTINDQYGHKAGDMILKDFGEVIKTTIRKSDICGRIGGEEFGFILPKANIEQCKQFADKLLAVIQARTIAYDDSNITYTASIGITVSIPKDSLKVDNLIHQADQALYQAKSDGRNCYRIASKELLTTLKPATQNAP